MLVDVTSEKPSYRKDRTQITSIVGRNSRPRRKKGRLDTDPMTEKARYYKGDELDKENKNILRNEEKNVI